MWIRRPSVLIPQDEHLLEPEESTPRWWLWIVIIVGAVVLIFR